MLKGRPPITSSKGKIAVVFDEASIRQSNCGKASL